MEVTNSFFDLFNLSLPLNLLVKFFLVGFFFFYLLFAFLLVREFILMSSSIKTPIEKQLKILTYANIIIALFLFLAAAFLI